MNFKWVLPNIRSYYAVKIVNRIILNIFENDSIFDFHFQTRTDVSSKIV
jgi:hypothetical protein